MSQPSDDAFLQRAARQLLRDHHLAEDVVQEALLASLERNGDVRHQRRFLLGVVRHLSIDVLRSHERRNRRESLSARPAVTPGTDEVVQQRRTRVMLRACVRSLPPRYETVLRLRYYEGRPPREIARVLNLPVETVRTRIKRGLAQLRLKLEQEYGGDDKALGVALAPIAWGTAERGQELASGGIATGVLQRVRAWLTPAACLAPIVLGGALALEGTTETTAHARPPAVRRVAAASASSAPTPAPGAGGRTVATATLGLELHVAGTRVPVRGVRVDAGWSESGGAGSQVSGTSDELGRLDLAVPSERELELTVHGTDLTAELRCAMIVETSDGDRRRLDVPALRSVSGVVRDETRRTVADARVDVRGLVGESEGELWDTVRTDELGRYAFPTLPASFVIEARSGDRGSSFELRAVDVEPGTYAGIDLDLLPAATLRGFVVDEVGAPLSGVTVHAWPECGISRTVQGAGLYYDGKRTTTSDAAGGFQFDDLPGVGVRWRVVADRPPLVSAWTSGSPGAIEPVELRLARGHTVSVVVTDLFGRPIEGAEVLRFREATRAWDDARVEHPGVVETLTTDVHGACRFEGQLEAAPTLIAVRAPGFGTVFHGPTTLSDPVRIALPRARTIAGSVILPAGETQVGGLVTLRSTELDYGALGSAGFSIFVDLAGIAGQATIGADGRFEISAAPGPLGLLLGVHRGPGELDVVLLDVAPGADEVRVPLKHRPDVAGRVVDAADGRGLDSVDVWVQSASLGIRRRVRTAADGRFRASLPAASDWLLVFDRTPFALKVVPVRLPEPELLVELRRPCTLEVCVVDDFRQPVPEALLELSDREGAPLLVEAWEARFASTCAVGPLGRVRLPGLPAAPLRVSVSVPQRAEPWVFELDLSGAERRETTLTLAGLDLGVERGTLALDVLVDAACVAPRFERPELPEPGPEARPYAGPLRIAVFTLDGREFLTLAGTLGPEGLEPDPVGRTFSFQADRGGRYRRFHRTDLWAGPEAYAASRVFADPAAPLSALPVPLRGGWIEVTTGAGRTAVTTLPQGRDATETPRRTLVLPED